MTGYSLPFQLPTIKDRVLEAHKYANWLVSLHARKHRSTVTASTPWDVTLNVTTHCQLSCPYCETGNGSLQRSSGLLTPDRFHYHMKPLYNNLFILRMFGTGESLLNRQFPKMIEKTKGKEIFSLLSTNLSLKFSDELIDELLLCGLGIIAISCDGTSQKTYEKYRRGGDYELVIENMQRLIARKKALGLQYPIIEWRFLVFEHNKHEIDRARHLAWMYGVDQISIHAGSAPARGASVIRATDVNLSPATVGPAFTDALKNKKTTLLDAIKKLPDEQRKTFGAIPPALRYSKCDWLYFGTTLFPSGGVSPCCVSNNEPNDFGTMDPATHANFIKIWRNEKYREAREFFHPHKKNKEANVICASCPNMASMDSQFVMPLRAVLRNAPAWVLKILACRPEIFFTNTDYYTLRPEMLGLQHCRSGLNNEVPADLIEAIRTHAGEITNHSPILSEHYRLFANILEQGDATDTKGFEVIEKGIALSDELAHKTIALSGDA